MLHVTGAFKGIELGAVKAAEIIHGDDDLRAR